ncbi:hypothetical protein KFE25_001588 [Diacronema lutheri]|uniref:Rad21/Rec8-like protein N-terminal domain-containing protein n=1 Tax=Diacronema lutheri TaxID=2081491 RepID=A0A8J6CAN9_DIALT|nr:hypothetical protein KFE25_001588 [Diacronema lutheri]
MAFFSRDLLNRKTSIGALWWVGNGRISERQLKAVSIHADVEGLAAALQAPANPLALRAQAVLLRGLVVISDEQARLLLEDALRELLRFRAAYCHAPLDMARPTERFASLTRAPQRDRGSSDAPLAAYVCGAGDGQGGALVDAAGGWVGGPGGGGGDSSCALVGLGFAADDGYEYSAELLAAMGLRDDYFELDLGAPPAASPSPPGARALVPADGGGRASGAHGEPSSRARSARDDALANAPVGAAQSPPERRAVPQQADRRHLLLSPLGGGGGGDAGGGAGGAAADGRAPGDVAQDGGSGFGAIRRGEYREHIGMFASLAPAAVAPERGGDSAARQLAELGRGGNDDGDDDDGGGACAAGGDEADDEDDDGGAARTSEVAVTAHGGGAAATAGASLAGASAAAAARGGVDGSRGADDDAMSGGSGPADAGERTLAQIGAAVGALQLAPSIPPPARARARTRRAARPTLLVDDLAVVAPEVYQAWIESAGGLVRPPRSASGPPALLAGARPGRRAGGERAASVGDNDARSRSTTAGGLAPSYSRSAATGGGSHAHSRTARTGSGVLGSDAALRRWYARLALPNVRAASDSAELAAAWSALAGPLPAPPGLAPGTDRDAARGAPPTLPLLALPPPGHAPPSTPERAPDETAQQQPLAAAELDDAPVARQLASDVELGALADLSSPEALRRASATARSRSRSHSTDGAGVGRALIALDDARAHALEPADDAASGAGDPDDDDYEGGYDDALADDQGVGRDDDEDVGDGSAAAAALAQGGAALDVAPWDEGSGGEGELPLRTEARRVDGPAGPAWRRRDGATGGDGRRSAHGDGSRAGVVGTLAGGSGWESGPDDDDDDDDDDYAVGGLRAPPNALSSAAWRLLRAVRSLHAQLGEVQAADDELTAVAFGAQLLPALRSPAAGASATDATPRRVAARALVGTLLLASHGRVTLSQSMPYGEILISPGPTWADAALEDDDKQVDDEDDAVPDDF